jgi:hypothetical protein
MRHWRHAMWFALLTAVAGVTGCSHSAKPVPSLGLVWEPYQSGWGTPHPSAVFNGGDPTGRITNVTWQSWGSPEAVGHGTGYYLSPTAAALTGELEPATIVAWGPRDLSGEARLSAGHLVLPDQGRKARSHDQLRHLQGSTGLPATA